MHLSNTRRSIINKKKHKTNIEVIMVDKLRATEERIGSALLHINGKMAGVNTE